MSGWIAQQGRPRSAFISSVRRGLEEHRDAAAACLLVAGHRPVRFEDFAAQNSAARTACLEAVRTADLFILLLGAYYGETQPQSGLSATHEEYNAAKTSGAQILVFKQSGIEMEQRQRAFAETVGGYVEGRFWKEFSGPADLVGAIGAALQTLPDRTVPVQWWPATGLSYNPIHAERNNQIAGAPQYTPIIELHIVPATAVPLRSAAASRGLAEQATEAMRRTGFLVQEDAVQLVPDGEAVHLRRPSHPERNSPGGFGGVTTDRYRGVRLGTDGATAAYAALPTDGFGAITNDQDLTQRAFELFQPLTGLLPPAGRLAVTGVLCRSSMVQIGEAADHGRRNRGSMRMGENIIALPADRIADRQALLSDPMAPAQEVAARLINHLGTSR